MRCEHQHLSYMNAASRAGAVVWQALVYTDMAIYNASALYALHCLIYLYHSTCGILEVTTTAAHALR